MEKLLKIIADVEKFLSKYKLTSLGLLIGFLALKFFGLDVWSNLVLGAFIGINFVQLKTMVFDAIEKFTNREQEIEEEVKEE